MKITSFNPLIVTKDPDKARYAAANETVDTGSSRFNIMVSDTGYILAVSQHIKD